MIGRSGPDSAAWLPRAGMACHAIVTTLLDRWEVGWQALDVAPLSPAESVTLIERTAGRSLADRFGAQLAEAAAGLPVQLVPGCAMLAHEDKRGRADAAAVMQPLRDAKDSFDGLYRVLSLDERLVLHAAARLLKQGRLGLCGEQRLVEHRRDDPRCVGVLGTVPAKELAGAETVVERLDAACVRRFLVD